MQGTLPAVRRSSNKLALLALVGAGAALFAFTACAEAPVDEDLSSAPVAETAKTESEQHSAKLPPSNPPAPAPADAGTSTPPPKDAGTTQPPQDSGTTQPQDSGTTTPTGGSCASNPLYVVKAFEELNKTSPRTCGLMGGTCKSTECCFDIYGVCIDP